jgi:hypothetical protein
VGWLSCAAIGILSAQTPLVLVLVLVAITG